jgi:hypothetical protein
MLRKLPYQNNDEHGIRSRYQRQFGGTALQTQNVERTVFEALSQASSMLAHEMAYMALDTFSWRYGGARDIKQCVDQIQPHTFEKLTVVEVTRHC